MHGEMLTYGLKRGTQNELLHIDSVPNGLGCDCVCPHCKHELMAKNGGSKNTHHFAHASGTEECGKGRITALHILAQQVLANDMRVMLPDYIGQYYPPVRTGLMVFDEVQIEKTNNVDDSQIRPDCIGIKYDEFGLTHKLLIEIRVTHKVDEQKQQFIRNAGIACIEINLSDMLNTDYTKESVTQRLIEEKEDRVWICCPIYDKRNEENKQKRAKAEKEAEEQRKRDEEEYRKAIRDEHRERIEEGRKREESKLREQQT